MNELENKIKHCVKCNKTFTSNTHYLIHCETELHKTGKRKTRTDKKEDLKCNICNLYSTRQPTNLKLHIFILGIFFTFYIFSTFLQLMGN